MVETEIAGEVAHHADFIHRIVGEQFGTLERMGRMPSSIRTYQSEVEGCVGFCFSFDEIRTRFTMSARPGKLLDKDAVAFRLKRNAKQIEINLNYTRARRNISLANAAVMQILGIEEQVRSCADRPLEYLWIDAGERRLFDFCHHDYAELALTLDGRDIKLQFDNTYRPGDVRILIETSHLGSSRDEVWGNGCLLIKTRESLPQTLMMAAAGRPLDEVISGTAFHGRGFTLKRMGC